MKDGVSKNTFYNVDGRLTTCRTATYSYDDNGNLIQKNDGGQMTNYTWSYENRLTGVALPGGTVLSYEYTTDGKMLSRTQSGVKTWFAYDFAEVNGFDDMLAEYNATGVLQARYVHGPGIDEPLAVIKGGTTKYYLRDALGSVTGLAVSQSLSTTYHYEAFGDTRAWSGTIDHYGFTSRELDSSSDLYFYRARWYDAEAGRFVSEDPSGMADGPNLYSYASGNPTTWVDPSGLWSLGEWPLYCRYFWWTWRCGTGYRLTFTEPETRFILNAVNLGTQIVTAITGICAVLCAPIAPFLALSVGITWLTWKLLDWIDSLGNYRGLYIEGFIINQPPVLTWSFWLWHN